MNAGSSISARKRWITRFAALLAVAAIVMVGASSALAAGGAGTSSASDQYDKPVTVVKGTTATASSTSATAQPVAATSSGGTLPFTGVSLIWPAIGAVALVGFGLMLRRQDRKN